MARLKFLIVSLLILAIISAGCIAPPKSSNTSITGSSGSTIGGSSGAKTNTTRTNTSPQPGPIPNTTWGNASLHLSSSPMGADAYVNDYYVGLTPMTINNLSGGIKYNVSFRLQGYGRYNGTVTAKNGTTVDFTGTLPEAKPIIDILVTNASSQRVAGVCIYTCTGTVTNSGYATARFLNVSLEFTPQDTKAYAKKVTWTYIDTLLPGTAAGFDFYIAVPCDGNYKGQIKYDGIYVTGSDQLRIDKKISGTVKI